MSSRRKIYGGNRATVTDTDTGEILQLTNDDRVIIEQKIADNQPIYFNKGVEFVKLYENIIPKLIQELTPLEVTFVLALAPLVSYTDCVVRKTSHKNSDVATAKDISEILNIEDSKVRRLLSSLRKKGVILKCSTGTIIPDYYGKKTNLYVVNPYIYFKGIKVSPFVLEAFDKSGWKELLSEH